MNSGLLVGMGNKEGYSHFTFKKRQQVLQLLKKMLIEVSSDIFVDSVHSMIYSGWKPGMDDPEKELKEKSMAELTDQYYNFNGIGYNIDIIFGKNRVFMFCHMDQEKIEDIRNSVKERLCA